MKRWIKFLVLMIGGQAVLGVSRRKLLWVVSSGVVWLVVLVLLYWATGAFGAVVVPG